MTFLIITHVLHKKQEGSYYAYAPYVSEMNLWLKHVDRVEVVAPLVKQASSAIDLPYNHEALRFTKVPAIAFISLAETLRSLCLMPLILYRLFIACYRADHIHLRCPGNMGLLGCFVQLFFLRKTKTAKYAGNWDPKAKQPISYRLQKWLLSNTFLARRMQVLVYGNWPKQTHNIKPFFTASFSDSEKEAIRKRDYNNALNFVFVGSLVKGKRPLLAIQVVEALRKSGRQVYLNIYGDGELREDLEVYVKSKKLSSFIYLHGNRDKGVIKQALRESHFAMLLSVSEGWPKAIAEAMFFRVIPVATSISCVPDMLGAGKRGILVTPHKEAILNAINKTLKDADGLNKMSILAQQWSQQYTLEGFESAITELLDSNKKITGN